MQNMYHNVLIAEFPNHSGKVCRNQRISFRYFVQLLMLGDTYSCLRNYTYLVKMNNSFEVNALLPLSACLHLCHVLQVSRQLVEVGPLFHSYHAVYVASH